MDTGITVQNLLDCKHFKNITRVVAGHDGLSKSVRWVHILEVRDVVKESVDGRELVLTTGIGFITKEVAINFIKKLIEQDVTGLCIETALYYNVIDQELIDLADENDFPLIEITVISRFVDISKELNTLILNSESQLYQNADNYEQQLYMIKGVGNIEDGLRYTAEYLNVEVALLLDKGAFYATLPKLAEELPLTVQELDTYLENEEIYFKGKLAVKKLLLFGKGYGYLMFVSKNGDISQFDLLILGRLSIRIKKELSSELIRKEEKKYKNIAWIKKWLNGDLNHEQVLSRLNKSGVSVNISLIFVCCIKQPAQTQIDDFQIHTSIVVRKIFEEENFHVLGYIDKDIISYVVMSAHNDETNIVRIKRAVQSLQTYENSFIDYSNITVSIGKWGCCLEDVHRSYLTSMEILENSISGSERLIIYDEMNIKRIIYNMDRGELELFISDYLKELLDEENLELLQTLKVYYECNCSKKNTAEKLYIVRQTLYFRLHKIKDILGVDFEDNENRLAIEFAIKANWIIKDEKEE